jgi:hypothetical protein
MGRIPADIAVCAVSMQIEQASLALPEQANFAIVAYSTFLQPSRPVPRVMSLPSDMPPMAESFVVCILEERGGNSVPRAAIIFKSDVTFDCPRMPEFILQMIDSVDAIKKLSRKSSARLVVSQFVLKNPLAELDLEQCEEIFHWQYLGHINNRHGRLM